MKLRCGFVSNSSSCTFILVYENAGKTTDPLDVIQAVRDYPDKDIILDAGPSGDGSDIFFLDPGMKSLIRKYPREFRDACSGARKVHDQDVDSNTGAESRITAYIGDVQLIPSPIESSANVDVDMSDIPNPCPQYGEPGHWDYFGADEDSRKKMESWYRIKDQRQENKLAQKVEALHKTWRDRGYMTETVDVSYHACSDTYLFKERFLTPEDSDASCWVKGHQDLKNAPFAVGYTDFLYDRDLMLEIIKTSSSRDSIAIAPYNDVEELNPDILNLDLYFLGQEEKDLILQHKEEFLNSPLMILMLTDAKVYKDGDCIITRGCRLLLGYGVVSEILPGQDLEVFKEVFLQE